MCVCLLRRYVRLRLAISMALESNPTAEELRGYMPLVRRVASAFCARLPPNVLREDLIAAGTIGLLDALRRSADRGPVFDWYARVRIRGAVVDELRSEDWLSRRARQRSEVARAEGACVGLAFVALEETSAAHSRALVDDGATPEERVEALMQRTLLVRAMAKLAKREVDILAWHYVHDVPFQEIALRLGVSGARVSQLHSRALKALRQNLDATSHHPTRRLGVGHRKGRLAQCTSRPGGGHSRDDVGPFAGLSNRFLEATIDGACD